MCPEGPGRTVPTPSIGTWSRLPRRLLPALALAWVAILPVRVGGEERAFVDAVAFDVPVAVEILPMEESAATRDALADALIEINELESLLDPDTEFGRSLGALNRAAGEGAIPLDFRVVEVLRKAMLFCIWSENAHGPVGGVLYGAWGLRRSAGADPDPSFVGRAVESAACHHLQLDLENERAELDQGSRVDLWGFAKGYAVDRAILRLEQAGAVSGWVQIGNVVRAFQTDPGLPGWQTEMDGTSNDDRLVERLVLANQALAMVTRHGGPRLRMGGSEWPPYLDQRSGAPVADKTAVFVVTESALDAQGLAVALFVQNSREGQYRSGLLDPRPAVKWLLGTREPPLENSRGWADLDKWSPVRRPGGS